MSHDFGILLPGEVPPDPRERGVKPPAPRRVPLGIPANEPDRKLPDRAVSFNDLLGAYSLEQVFSPCFSGFCGKHDEAEQERRRLLLVQEMAAFA